MHNLKLKVLLFLITLDFLQKAQRKMYMVFIPHQ